MKQATLVLVGLLLAGCGDTGMGATAAPSASPQPTALSSGAASSAPTVVATSSVAGSPSSRAVLDGEPWMVYEWYFHRKVKDIALMRPDGSDSHPIADDVETELSHWAPSWSADGKRIVFIVGDFPVSRIWTANADGTGARQLRGADEHCRQGVTTGTRYRRPQPHGRGC
jgi:hypothetical protein